MSTTKRMYELLTIVRDDPGRPPLKYASIVGALPIEVEAWLEHMQLDGMVEDRPGTFCSLPGWYITDRGLEVIAWYTCEDEDTETMET